jgi:hypothetical protein
VAEATARVASGLAGTAVSTGTSSSAATVASTATTEASASAIVSTTTLGAVTGNVALLAALVALLSAAGGTPHTGTSLLGALTADVAGTTAAVACLLGLRVLALAAHVALLSAVVAGRGSLGGALGGAVGRVSACCSCKLEYEWRKAEFDLQL